ncbi:MAG TPA: hypothetical protein V6D22_11340, partial [Candidatus Obscuribacterales bacterium]
MLSNHSLIRLACLFGVIALWRFDPTPGYVVLLAGYVHYPLSFFYAWRKIKASLTDPRKGLGTLSAIAVGIGLFWLKFPLIIFFGIHHVFNEVYLLKREICKQFGDNAGRVTTGALVINAALYCVTLRRAFPFSCLPHRMWWLVLALA